MCIENQSSHTVEDCTPHEVVDPRTQYNYNLLLTGLLIALFGYCSKVVEIALDSAFEDGQCRMRRCLVMPRHY